MREMRNRGDVEQITRMLEIGDLNEREKAASMLGELKSRSSVKPLIRVLSRDEAVVRANAAWALGEIGDPEALFSLIDLLYDPSRKVQINAAWSLGRLGDANAIPDLNKVIKNGFPELQKIALEAVNLIESEAHNPGKSGKEMVESIDIPLITLEVPKEFECNYLSLLGGESKKIESSTMHISEDVIIRDTGNSAGDSARRIILGLKKDFNGHASVDILFRYAYSEDDGMRTRSAWLRIEQKEEKRNNNLFDREIKYEPIEPEAPEPTEEPGKQYISNSLEHAFPHQARIQEPVVQKAPENIDSAVRLLNDIGMSGVVKAASTVDQVSGQEENLNQFRALQTSEIYDDIKVLGDQVVLVNVGLHGKGCEMTGIMQFYISEIIALEMANDLLCNPPDAFCREFNDDIKSTLSETANIFGGQYISALSEYIGFPILIDAPLIKKGTVAQITESVMKNSSGEYEFALATDLDLGKNRIGRLIMLLDPGSYNTIVSKLF
jgi:chemotaxis protein CheY-P-specific phosphatase CheC